MAKRSVATLRRDAAWVQGAFSHMRLCGIWGLLPGLSQSSRRLRPLAMGFSPSDALSFPKVGSVHTDHECAGWQLIQWSFGMSPVSLLAS